MHILEARDRVETLHRDYLVTLKAAGYDNLTLSKRRIAIKNTLSKIKATLFEVSYEEYK